MQPAGEDTKGPWSLRETTRRVPGVLREQAPRAPELAGEDTKGLRCSAGEGSKDPRASGSKGVEPQEIVPNQLNLFQIRPNLQNRANG